MMEKGGESCPFPCAGQLQDKQVAEVVLEPTIPQWDPSPAS